MTRFMIAGIALATLVRLQPPAQGRPLPSCEADADSRRFDFWLGEWDVRSTQGAKAAGSSRIEKISGGCALLENWTSASGTSGKSINFYNRVVRQWQQYWVGQTLGDATQFTTSTWNGATLVFYADVVRPDGTPAKRRLAFTPVASDTVRQFGEISADGGRTWATEYDLTYVRRR